MFNYPLFDDYAVMYGIYEISRRLWNNKEFPSFIFSYKNLSHQEEQHQGLSFALDFTFYALNNVDKFFARIQPEFKHSKSLFNRMERADLLEQVYIVSRKKSQAELVTLDVETPSSQIKTGGEQPGTTSSAVID